MLLSCLALAACKGDSESEAPVLSPNEGEHHPMVGQIAPDFIGEVPGGGWLRLRAFRNKPLVLLIFRPGAPFNRELVEALGRFRRDPATAQTSFLGIALDSMEDTIRFGEATDGALPTLRDPGPIAGDYGVRQAAAAILIDSRGFVRFRMDGFAGPRFQKRLDALAGALRRLSSLGELPAREIRLHYTKDPRAPVFTARDIDGRRVDLVAFRGHVVILHFFDQDSQSCQRDLPRLVPALKELRSRGVRAIGVAPRDFEGGMRRFLTEHGIDYPVIIDADHSLSTRFESTRTPDLFVIDPLGFIRFREEGDRPDRAELTRLQVRLALGQESPTALAKELPTGRYVGDGQCSACHEREWRSWLSTPHSIAWDALSDKEKWNDPECVACHVTGRGGPGGYSDADTTSHMTNVQCEVCHGMGGGHADGRRLSPPELSSVCQACHTGKFVLNFPLDEALPLVAHPYRPDLERLFKYSESRRRRLEEINRQRLRTFTSGVAHVGAEACRDCHRKEYDQWSRTPHAAAYARLLAGGRGADPACTPCHTTGFGFKDGFGAGVTTAGLTGVQCEVCHGPGGDHVEAPANLKRETIYGIADPCSSCLVQGVCTTCHDARNDPDFEFEPALARVKH